MSGFIEPMSITTLVIVSHLSQHFIQGIPQNITVHKDYDVDRELLQQTMHH